MRGFAVLCLVLIGVATANWSDGSNDPSHSNLGFVMVNMTCNDKETSCGDCYVAHSHGLVYSNVFEYTTEPYTFLVSIKDGLQDWYWKFVQDDPSELFRFCKETQIASTLELGMEMWAALCIDNDFSGITVPVECTKPVATVTMDTHFAYKKANGQQTLYCLP